MNEHHAVSLGRDKPRASRNVRFDSPAIIERLEERALRAQLVVAGQLAGVVRGSDLVDEGVAPYNAIPNPLAEVVHKTASTEVQAFSQANATPDGTSVVLQASMKIDQRPGSFAETLVGTTWTGRADGVGTPIDVEILPTGNEQRGDRVLVRIDYEWGTDLYSVNENTNRLQAKLLVQPPTGFGVDLIREDYYRYPGDNSNRSGASFYQFEAQIGQVFGITAFVGISFQGDRLRGELDFTDLTLRYGMTTTYLGPATPPPVIPLPPVDPPPTERLVYVRSVRAITTRREGTRRIEVRFSGEVLSASASSPSSYRVISRGVTKVRIRSVYASNYPYTRATIWLSRAIPPGRTIRFAVLGSRILHYPAGEPSPYSTVRAIDAARTGFSGSTWVGTLRGRRIV